MNVDVSISLSVSTSTTQLMTTEFAWPIVMATAVSVTDVQQFTEVTQTFVNSMVTGMYEIENFSCCVKRFVIFVKLYREHELHSLDSDTNL